MEERKSRKEGLAKKAAKRILASRAVSASEATSVSNNDSLSLTSSNGASEQQVDNGEEGLLYAEHLSADVCFVGSKGEELSRGNKLIGSRQSQEFTESSFEAVIPKYKHLLNSSQLARIPVSEARRIRSGSTVSTTLLGSDELNNCLPGRRLYIFVSTFNMAGKDILDRHIQEILFPEHVVHTADLYAIALQEAAPECSAKEFRVWEKRLQCCLSHCKQVLIRSVWMGVQHLALFIRRELVWFVSDSKTFARNTRPVSNVKTKGAIAVWLKFFGTTFLFISCHLSHGQDILPRISECNRIESFLRTRNAQPLEGNILDDSDYVFWFGDMNFRLTIDTFMLENLHGLQPQKCDIELLLERDQLKDLLKEGNTLSKFGEHAIGFLPTYKFHLGENIYLTQLRWPAYTDRVIYRIRQNDSNDLRCMNYDSVMTVCSSDHKPVYAFFSAAIVPETRRLRASHAKVSALNQILEGNRRYRAEKTSSQICTIV
uniref:IPPc domain-containing protein n=1 Tax=Trichuris muris TaxID=70415 RepID=A0A5S6QNK1_TRIMR